MLKDILKRPFLKDICRNAKNLYCGTSSDLCAVCQFDGLPWGN